MYKRFSRWINGIQMKNLNKAKVITNLILTITSCVLMGINVGLTSYDHINQEAFRWFFIIFLILNLIFSFLLL